MIDLAPSLSRRIEKWARQLNDFFTLEWLQVARFPWRVELSAKPGIRFETRLLLGWEKLSLNTLLVGCRFFQLFLGRKVSELRIEFFICPAQRLFPFDKCSNKVRIHRRGGTKLFSFYVPGISPILSPRNRRGENNWIGTREISLKTTSCNRIKRRALPTEGAKFSPSLTQYEEGVVV